MIRRTTSRSAALLLAASAATCIWTPALAQETRHPEQLFDRLFPHPTGSNGFEEIVKAGDLSRSSDLMDAVQMELSSGGALAQKRAAVADPKVRRAIELLRIGLNKPRVPLHEATDTDTLFPEFALFRHLARTLLVEQYVLLADGKVPEALESFRDTLRLGTATRADTIISGLVQVAIDAIGVRLVGDHLRQLSARDCDRLLVIAREWLAAPDMTAQIFEGEKGFVMRTWDKALTNPVGILELLQPGGEESDPAEEAKKTGFRAQIERVMTNRSAYASLVNTVKAKSAQRIDSQIAAAQQPPWLRVPKKPDDPRTLVDYLVDSIVPTLGNFGDRFTTEAATARLLGLHAAILRYLWENERLPERLEVLRVRDLLIDPHTGKPMHYKRTGPRTYELSSAGPYSRDSEGNVSTESRTPITIPRTPK